MLNENKSAIYVKGEEGDPVEEKTVFLPEVRDSYKYLGLEQAERDVLVNYDVIKGKTIDQIRKITEITLTSKQKTNLYNTTVVKTARRNGYQMIGG